ncbi:MAG: hypothetical protein HYW78_00965 [Parcubacteria group bacterium]|nr:hypothetical protein [Parcubacteria group bacterium]
MALATEMKSLVDDIQASRDARAQALDDIRKDTRHIIGDAKSMLKDFAKASEERAQEIKELAKDVKSFLKSSDENREKDFEATMKTVHTSLEDVKKDSKSARHAGKTIVKDAKALLATIAKDNKEQAGVLREELKKAEHERKTEFKSMIGDIQKDLKDIKTDVSKVQKDTKDMVSRYHHSRMGAQKHWASLSEGRKKSKKHKSEE